MYSGHFAVALASAGVSRRLPLWLLIAAAFSGDLLEGAVAAASVRDAGRTFSHSLPATMIAGAIVALAWRVAGGTWREAGLLLLVSMSHTLLDLFTGAKIVWPGRAPMGLSLYRKPYLDGAIEIVMCVAGWRLWRRAIAPERRAAAAPWGVLATLLISQLAATANLVAYGLGRDVGDLSKFLR